VVSYQQVKIRLLQLLGICIFGLCIGACTNQDTLSLTYTVQQSAQDFSIEKIHFFDNKNGLAMGGNAYQYGVAQCTEDGGLSWTLDTISQKIINDFDIVQDTIIGAGIDSYISRKQGLDLWQELRPSIYNNINGVIKIPKGYLLASGIAYKNGSILRLSNDLVLIDSIPFSGELNAIVRSYESHFHIAGYGQLHRTEDGGDTWQVNRQEGDNYQDMYFINQQIGWAVGDAGSILKTNNGGIDWSVQNKPTVHNKKQFASVHFSTEEDGIVAGKNGLVWITSNGGISWLEVVDVPDYNYTCVFMLENIAWLCSDQGHIIRLFL